jgi:hypothetical protein
LTLAVAGLLLVAGCRNNVEAATCAGDSGARGCLTFKSSANSYEIQATGFQANSDVLLTVQGPPNGRAPSSMRIRMTERGTFVNEGGIVSLVGGSGPTTVTFSGKTGSGTEVSIPVAVRR